MLFLELPVPLSINQLYVNQTKYDHKSKAYVPTGKRILSSKGLMSKKNIQKMALRQLSKQPWNIELTKEFYLYMDVIIFFPKKGMDADNIFKILNDSLQGIVFDNDSRVLPRVQRIFYDSENPRIIVNFDRTEYIGIFDNEQELSEFVENCDTCRWYQKGKCGVLNKAKEGRIQQEIENMMCNKYTEKKS